MTALLVGTGALAATFLAGTSVAADPFTAGQASTRALPIPAQARADLERRATAAVRGLGLQRGVRRSIERLEDRFAGVTYDEVTELDASGNPAALLRYAGDGSLTTAIALGWRVPGQRTLRDAATAMSRAAELLRAVGGASGDPVVSRLVDETGWRVAWPRVAQGAPVPGDGIRVDLWDDGSLHSLVRSERPLAGAPTRILDEPSARSIADRLLADWFGGPQAGLTVEGTDLGWVAPNDMFNPARPDAPASTLRLARILRVTAAGQSAGVFERLEIYIDAGSGELLGGDMLE